MLAVCIFIFMHYWIMVGIAICLTKLAKRLFGKDKIVMVVSLLFAIPVIKLYFYVDSMAPTNLQLIMIGGPTILLIVFLAFKSAHYWYSKITKRNHTI